MLFFAREPSRNPHPSSTAQLRLEQLEDRLVPSASMLDLATTGASVSLTSRSHNDTVAVFQQTDTQPTATGVIQSFVQLQSHGKSADIEQGYNTDARPVQFEEKTDLTFTHSLKLSDVPVVMINGIAYRQFLLGINQQASSPFLSLDQLQLYVASLGNLNNYSSFAKTLGGQTAVFDLNSTDNGGDQYVKLDARLSHGNGSGDLTFYVADRVFAGASPNQYVYLYSRFGDTFGANGGFEEWAVRKSVSGTGGSPDTLSGVVTDTSGLVLAGVAITLTNSQGAVIGTATTDLNGVYQFTGLTAGTYTLTETTPPVFYFTIGATAGTVNGTTDGTIPAGTTDMITQIVLGSGQDGINYDFTNVFVPI